MLKKEGEPIDKDEIIGETKGLFGLFKSQARAPIDGTIESISDVTGQVIIREAPIPINVMGHISGSIVEIISNEGAIVEAYGTYIQGIFGVGGETVGTLEVVVDSPRCCIDQESHPTHTSRQNPLWRCCRWERCHSGGNSAGRQRDNCGWYSRQRSPCPVGI